MLWQGRSKLDNWGGGADIHIYVFTHHKNNRFQKKLIVQNTVFGNTVSKLFETKSLYMRSSGGSCIQCFLSKLGIKKARTLRQFIRQTGFQITTGNAFCRLFELFISSSERSASFRRNPNLPTRLVLVYIIKNK